MKKVNLSLVCAVMMAFVMVLFVACKPEPTPEPQPEPEPDPEEPLPENCIKDVDGNVYETVVIGTQTWMKSNLRVKHYADGTPLIDGTDLTVSDTMKAYCYPDKVPHYYKQYALLYTWTAATRGTFSYRNPSGVKGICPDGWHMPSQREWKKLLDYVAAQPEFVCDTNNTRIAKALCSKDLWSQNKSYPVCSPSFDPQSNNLTGLSLIPAGTEEMGKGYGALYWATGENSSMNGQDIVIYANRADVMQSSSSKSRFLAVRCVKD